MADVIRKATNRFTKGMILDFSPENTKNEVLTHALNATLLTFNGNELSLQNDQGNARVETAYLPDGYVPVGTCEYGGIIYIVSYNPLEDKSQIGCFPSPERNVSGDELGMFGRQIERNFFQEEDKDTHKLTGNLLNNSQQVLLKNDKLNPGDKFIVCANPEIYNEKLDNLFVAKNKTLEDVVDSDYELISNPIIALNIVSIEDSGKIIYLNSDIRQYEKTNVYNINNEDHTDTYKYHILGQMPEGANQLAKDDIDNYRTTLSSGYSVFKSKTSGKLAILAELIMVDSYSVTHSLEPKKDESGEIIEGSFDIIIHTEVTPEINKNNYNTVPKLKYYYLDNSQGYLQISKNKQIQLFKEIEGKYVVNSGFLGTGLNSIYEPIDSEITTKLGKTLQSVSEFNFPLPKTYHGKMKDYEGDITGTTENSTYTKFTEGKFHRINKSQLTNIDYFINQIRAKFYYYSKDEFQYQKVTDGQISEDYIYYIKKEKHSYVDIERNIDYINDELYKLISVPNLATEEELFDKEVEKFKYQEVHTYNEATEEDIQNKEKLYYRDGDNKYVELTTSVEEGVTYYVLKVETTLVSIGNEVESGTVPGDIYYYPTGLTYEIATPEDKDKYFDFDTYPYESEKPFGSPITLFKKETEETYEEATRTEIENFQEYQIELFYKTDYNYISDIKSYDGTNQLFIVVPSDVFITNDNFKPSTEYNWINGQNDDSNPKFPKDYPIYLYSLSSFIPTQEEENGELLDNYKYNDLKLANIQLPSVVHQNGLDLPFKYDYTIVPCMSYGKLQHLAVSNTVDFSKLHAFNSSNFTTWKYRIDDNQLRLTFGAEIFDTYETAKVDALILEFYDCWGFAGSLEITDKKSYNGIFTKIIPLNTLNALSNKKIAGNDYSEEFVRNINIKENQGSFTYKDKPIQFNQQIGWKNDFLSEKQDNDCGTLYSNIIYGVKAYLRRTKTDGSFEFIKKKDLFLYTLPIYNEYYYSVDDFSTLENPELEFALTYKLKDSSTKSEYNENGIINGYNAIDSSNINTYLGGFCDQSSLSLIKYYKYKGTTDLYLEIGLKKDYENVGLSYDPKINQLYSCKLQLIGNDNNPYTVNSGVEGLTSQKDILNYNSDLKETISFLKFDKGSVKEVEDLSKSTFISGDGPEPIKITYEFVVGYKAIIDDIRSTEVQATTVCALFHKTPTGEFNYSDFGVYEQSVTDYSGNTVNKLLSSTMFYNEGTSEKEVFGICKQIKTSGTNMLDECQIGSTVETDAQEIKTQGKLNTGEPLKQLVQHIGKLTFCQPHAHGLSSVNGVNIHEGNGTYNYGIPSEAGGGGKYGDMDSNDKTYGIAPRDYLFRHPKYNLCLNTKNSINYYSEFISTLDYKEISSSIWLYNTNTTESDAPYWYGPTTLREYTGFTGEDIATFNQKLIKTMSSIYAYNPDYDSLTVNLGNVSLQDYNPSFTSNLLNTYSNITFAKNETLNDYIYLGPLKYSNYLNNLSKHSKSITEDIIKTSNDGKALSSLQFICNYDYCGTEINKYLISTLTYNTPVPKEIAYELEFSNSSNVVVKHSDGSTIFVEGSPNKKTLYGYNSQYKKLVQLDVSNYTIDVDGNLKLSEDSAKEMQQMSYNVNEEVAYNLYNNGHHFTIDFTNEKGESSTIGLQMYLQRYSNGGNFKSQLNYKDGSFFIGVQSSNRLYNMECIIEPYIHVTSQTGNYKHQVKVDSLTFTCNASILSDKVTLEGSKIPLNMQSYENLQNLCHYNKRWEPITLIDYNGSFVEDTNPNYYYAYQDADSPTVTLNGNYLNSDFDNTIDLNDSGNIKVNFTEGLGVPYTGEYTIGLIELKLSSINFTITQTSNLETLEESFVKTAITTEYTETVNNRYKVISKYNRARLRGSSITLNDLIYEPSQQGHRLFIKNNLCQYNNAYRGKLYYRSLDVNKDRGTWVYDNTKNINTLYLYTGPCFTTDNLNND